MPIAKIGPLHLAHAPGLRVPPHMARATRAPPGNADRVALAHAAGRTRMLLLRAFARSARSRVAVLTSGARLARRPSPHRRSLLLRQMIEDVPQLVVTWHRWISAASAKTVRTALCRAERASEKHEHLRTMPRPRPCRFASRLRHTVPFSIAPCQRPSACSCRSAAIPARL